jgi:NAD(P)-dependent dehydrogenase (short-subunit alcohol dehydrogenase family)
MIALVDRAEDYLREQQAWELPAPAAAPAAPPLREELAELRRGVSAVVGGPVIVQSDAAADGLEFSRAADVGRISQQGPATPDHVIRTKRLPLLGRDVQGYADAYRSYFDCHAGAAKEPKTMLDPAPRVILDETFGLCTVGRTAKDAQIVQDIYRHTMDIIRRAERLGGYRALPAQDIFDMEYWDLEQAKLRKGGTPPVFTGEVALITGAASGIGKACVGAFLERGAAVVGLDIDAGVIELKDEPAYLGLVCDVTDVRATEAALEQAVRRFGGLDMLVLNAGIFPAGCHIAELDLDEWYQVQEINLNANLKWMRACHPLLKRAPNGGRVVLVGSKNVAAPGMGAAAYSAAKAALTQVMRIAAMEWGPDGIRLNAVHPDAVFDTGIWTPEVLAGRAAHYGMTVDEYKHRNVMKVEITSADVAAMVAEMCGPLFAKTTAAQVPMDGGDVRVI